MGRFGPSAQAALLPLVVAAGMLAACSQEPDEAPKQNETELPKELAGQLARKTQSVATDIGTPMADRVATIGVLNKRNNLTQDLLLKPGEAKRIGNVIVKLAACERTPPWEKPPETGAFVQVLVNQRAGEDTPLRWQRVFSGWMFKNSPSLNVLEHPVYDVWVKDCAMNFPGEEAGPGGETGGESGAGKPAASPKPASPASGPASAAPAAPAAASTPAKPSGSDDQAEPR
jgi:hypothetical protein